MHVVMGTNCDVWNYADVGVSVRVGRWTLAWRAAVYTLSSN